MLAASVARAVPRSGSRAASTIALKYSNALYGAALSKSPDTLNRVHADLATISTTIKQNPDLAAFVQNPSLSVKDRATGISALVAKAEASGAKKDALSDVTKNLLALLSENGRLGEAAGVIEGFNELFAQYKGEVTVTVTSASPLPRDVLNRLETSLKQSQTGQKAKVLKITNKVNPSVLGGIVVDFADKTIDLSVQSRVTKLNTLLQQSV